MISNSEKRCALKKMDKKYFEIIKESGKEESK